MAVSSEINWQWRAYDSLSRDDLFAVFELRQAVFIIEQNCIYPDIDAADLSAYHLLGWGLDPDKSIVPGRHRPKLAAYLRMLPPKQPDDSPAIGRVIVAPEYRGQSLGVTLMKTGMDLTSAVFPEKSIVISAQSHLQAFYQQLGFVATSEVYDEDGIDHIDMQCLLP